MAVQPTDVDGVTGGTTGGAIGGTTGAAREPVRPRPGAWSPGVTATERRQPAAGDTVTRLLCATTHLHASFADDVVAQLLDEDHHATYPVGSVDHVLLARHAVQSYERRVVRDKWLRVVLVAGVAAALFVIVLGGLGVVPVLGVVPGVLLVALVTWCVAFGVVLGHYGEVHRTATAIVEDPAPESPPPLERLDDEERLEELADANAVVFSSSSPFEGAGVQLDQWSLSIDAAQPRHGAAGPPRRFTGVDVHEAMLRRLPRNLEPTPLSGHRLYVRGNAATRVPELFRKGPVPDDPAEVVRASRPGSRVPDHVVRAFMEKSFDYARVYTAFEMRQRGRQVVLTLFVRAVRSGDLLFVEGVVCAQLPPLAAFWDVYVPPRDPWAESVALWRTAAGATWRLLFAAPGRLWRSAKSRRSWRRQLVETVRYLDQAREIDFGATTSLRRTIGIGSLAAHFPQADVKMTSAALYAQVTNCLIDFLDEHDVDSGPLRMQRMTALNGQMMTTGQMTAAGSLTDGAASGDD